MYKIITGYIFIEKIRLHAFHGVLPQEQKTGNDYTISVRAEYDLRQAVETDDLTDTINYADIYQIVAGEMDKPSKLIEHVAGRIGKQLIDTYPNINSLEIKIIKHNPPMNAQCHGAGVEIHLINDKTKAQF
ncbi:MAG: dihydroneopterin aldolase [Prevotella sp.]